MDGHITRNVRAIQKENNIHLDNKNKMNIYLIFKWRLEQEKLIHIQTIF